MVQPDDPVTYIIIYFIYIHIYIPQENDTKKHGRKKVQIQGIKNTFKMSHVFI